MSEFRIRAVKATRLCLGRSGNLPGAWEPPRIHSEIRGASLLSEGEKRWLSRGTMRACWSGWNPFRRSAATGVSKEAFRWASN